MKVLFIIPLSLFLPIAVLLFTGHPGAADKIISIVFFLLSGSLIWALASKKGGWGI